MIAVLHRDEGQGTPLVYVPGVDGTGDLLLDTGRRLVEAGFRLIRLRYELGGEDSYHQLASSVERVLQECGLERVLCLSESFGAGVALQLALDHPRRVAGLAIVNGFAHHPWRVRLWMTRLGSPVAQGPLFRVGRRLVSPSVLFGRRRSAQVLESFAAMGSIGIDAAYRRRLWMIQRLDLRPRLSTLQPPLALFASDEDRIVPSMRAAREMQSLAPDVTLEVLHRAGHVVLPLPEEPWPQRMRSLAARCD